MGVAPLKKWGEKIDLQSNHLDRAGIYRTSYPTMANRYSSQLYPVCSPTKTIKRISINLKGLKTYKIGSLITINLIRNQYYKIPGGGQYFEMKQYLLNNPWFNRAFTREIEKYLKLSNNEDTTCQNVWNAPKAVPEEKRETFCKNKFIYFWLCGDSAALRAPLQLRCAGSRCGSASSCGAQAPGACSGYGSWALGHRFNSCGARAQLPRSMWDLSGPGIKPVSPAVARWVLYH